MPEKFHEGDDAPVQYRARNGAHESRYGAKQVIFFFSVPGHVKSRYGANGIFFIIFSPGPILGQDLGHVKSRRGANR